MLKYYAFLIFVYKINSHKNCKKRCPYFVCSCASLSADIAYFFFQVNLKAQISCKKSESLESSSSSEHFTPSDLKAFSSPSSTPHTMSPRMSPLLSPSPIHSIGGSVESLPSTLEKTIKVKKGQEQLGLEFLNVYFYLILNKY